MTLDQLLLQHQKEIDLFWACHWERAENLETDQKEIVAHFANGKHRSNDLLKNLLAEQRNQFEEKEKDDLDILLHMQKIELENILEKEEKRQKLESLLSNAPKQQDRGR